MEQWIVRETQLDIDRNAPKIKEENKCEWEVALSWALMAKNALRNIHGYSSYELVYGINPTKCSDRQSTCTRGPN